MTPHDTFACIRMAKAAREKGTIVSLDVDNVFEGIDKLLPLVDVCIASAGFCEKLLGITEKKAALREIASRYGCAVAGITLGASGSMIFCQDFFFETPSFDVPGGCVDTTGAGDAFRTGFLYGMLTENTVEESSRIANAVAALKCRGLGARSALPDERELTTLLKNA
jgi:sugar/nucleoside kinase (ribokinase family)